MKFSNCGLLMVVISLLVISGCTTLNPTDDEQQADANNGAQNTKVVLTPLETKVQTLQAQPNLYQGQAAERKAAIPQSALSQFQSGLKLKAEGKTSQALDRFKALSQQQPQLSGVWLQIAKLTLAQDDPESLSNAEHYLQQAVAVNPLNYVAHNELAQVLRHQGQFNQALKHYELALQSWPAFAEAYLNRGILYDLYLGKKELALADYELYQALTSSQSRQIKGWVMDLNRQLQAQQQAGQNGVIP